MENKITKEKFDKLIQQVEAAASPPQGYVFFVRQSWVDNMPEYFYKDNDGQLWFDTPWTCKTKAQIIPSRFKCDYGLLCSEEDVSLTIHNAIYQAFEKI